MRFSNYFNLNRDQPYLDFVDIRLDTDIAVFLDPTAIKSLTSPWANELSSLLQTYFDTVLSLIKSGNHDRAQHLLSCLNERNEFHLGYSKGNSKGHGFGSISAKTVWSSLNKSNAAVTGLLKDLEDTALLIKGIGTDMINDAVCNILRGPLIKYTQDMCAFYGIPLTPDVTSGPIWNPQNERWEETLIPLPMTDYGKVILVPKLLVRQNLSYQSDKFYRHTLLPSMQAEHIASGSSLVELLKNGRLRVTKKALMEKYGSDKLSIVRQSKNRPEILQQYKDEQERLPSQSISHYKFSELESTDPPNLTNLVDQLKGLKSGADSAHEYEDLIEKILTVIFYPSLFNPKKQQILHEGRKRVDITYTNEAKRGFFHWISMHYPCSLIFIECKTMEKKLAIRRLTN